VVLSKNKPSGQAFGAKSVSLPAIVNTSNVTGQTQLVEVVLVEVVLVFVVVSVGGGVVVVVVVVDVVVVP
jgi:hypothetical protein